eukprot:6733681-Pyramimonas_sp.AAC.1
MWTKVFFLAKLFGGFRPIALLHVLARALRRLRRGEIARWQAANYRSFTWGTRGKATDKCVWVQAAWAEWAHGRGPCSGTILADLKKAFEL